MDVTLQPFMTLIRNNVNFAQQLTNTAHHVNTMPSILREIAIPVLRVPYLQTKGTVLFVGMERSIPLKDVMTTT